MLWLAYDVALVFLIAAGFAVSEPALILAPLALGWMKSSVRSKKRGARRG